MNSIPVPPADNVAPESGDPRLTALALGEITDAHEAHALREAIARDPRLQLEFAQTQALATLLRDGFRKELETATTTPATAAQDASPLHATAPYPAPLTAASASPASRRRSGGFSTAPSRRPETFKDNVLRFVLVGATALGAAAALFLATRTPDTATAKLPENQVAATSTADPVSLPGIIHLRPSTGDEPRGASAIRTPRPGSIRVAPPVNSPDAVNLATLVSRLPARIPRGGENDFLPLERPPREIALCLASPGIDYARRLQDSIALGRLPERRLLRIDALVNAFVSAPANDATPGIELVTEAVPAPWAPGHWLVRATVQANGTDASIVATQARASTVFSPEQASTCRLLGWEDGGENLPAFDLPATIRTGETLTTLFELVPAAGAKTGKPLGELKIAFTDKNGKRTELSQTIAWPASGGIAAATDETRIAAAAAALGLALRQSPHRGGATVALAGHLAGTARLPNRALFDSLLRDSSALR
jgi:hypothetical protein